MTTVPVTAPLVPVPAIVELAIVPVPVPAGTIRPVWTVGVGAAGPVPVWTIRPIGVRTIRTVPIRTVRTICAGTIGAIWSVRALRAIGAVRPIGAPRLVRLIPAGTVRPVWAIGTLSFWTIRAVGSLLIGALRTLDVRPCFRPRLVRTRLIGTRLIGTRLGVLARRFLALSRPYGHVVAITLRRSAPFRAAWAVLAGLGALRPFLGQGRQRCCGGHEEGGNRREHEKRTFHGQNPRTPRLGGLIGK